MVSVSFRDGVVRRLVESVEEFKERTFDELRLRLEVVQERYGKSEGEVAEVFVKASGDTQRMEMHFQGKSVPLWSYLEDLALSKPVDSPQFKVLLVEKGEDEIARRKQFLLG